MDKEKKVGLVLEGGSMRGMYTAGVLDVFMDKKIEIDGIIGVFAGALFSPNYFSKQKGRVIRYNKRFCKDYRYMMLGSKGILESNCINCWECIEFCVSDFHLIPETGCGQSPQMLINTGNLSIFPFQE